MTQREPILIRDLLRTGMASMDRIPVCKSCGKPIQPLDVEILGREMTVYPDCECVGAARAREAERERHEQEMARMRHLVRKSRMGQRYRACTFDNFEAEPANRLAYKAAKAFCDNTHTGGRRLMLMGGVVPAGQRFGNLQEFGRDELETFCFKSSDNPTRQVSLYSVRLDDD